MSYSSKSLVFLLINVFFVYVISETNSTKSLQNVTTNSSTKAPAVFNETNKNALVAEGGTILDNTPSLVLPGEINKISVKDFINEIPSASTSSRVKPRKGVGDIAEDKTEQHSKNENGIVHDELQVENKPPASSVAPKVDNRTKSGDYQIKANKVPLPKKPLILSYEALEKMDHGKSKNLTIPALNSSPETSVQSQMPSPSKDGPMTKLYSKNPHPEMIMPLVITILVVPMFAVVGYMILRRGQEAWKNRHYKRMDFLLDGMYND